MKGVTGLSMLIAQAKYACEFFLERPIDDAVIPEITKAVEKSADYENSDRKRIGLRRRHAEDLSSHHGKNRKRDHGNGQAGSRPAP